MEGPALAITQCDHLRSSMNMDMVVRGTAGRVCKTLRLSYAGEGCNAYCSQPQELGYAVHAESRKALPVWCSCHGSSFGAKLPANPLLA